MLLSLRRRRAGFSATTTARLPWSVRVSATTSKPARRIIPARSSTSCVVVWVRT